MGIHVGDEVFVGGFNLYAAGAARLTQQHLDRVAPDVVVDLAAHRRFNSSLVFPPQTRVIVNHLEDFGGVSDGWREFLEGVIADLKDKKRILVFCRGGHGRTGCFLSSLVAILEPEVADPIQAVRERYCRSAVESVAQARAVFALKEATLPLRYQRQLY